MNAHYIKLEKDYPGPILPPGGKSQYMIFKKTVSIMKLRITIKVQRSR